MKPSEITGPIAQFQCTVSEKDDFKKLIHSLNSANASSQISKAELDEAFEQFWPHLQAELDKILGEKEPSPFRDVFGEDVFSPEDFHLVYAQLVLPPVLTKEGEVEKWPYRKLGEETRGPKFSIERPISSCELRAAKYLTETIGDQAKIAPSLSSDIDLKSSLDVSFVAFGGPLSNYKTRDVINNRVNHLLKFDNLQFTSPHSGRTVVRPEPGFDYGLILKIHPNQFPQRSWFACAGLSEWGTSGAACYLAKKWQEIHDFAGDAPFAIIVRVTPEQDESAEPIIKVKNPADLRPFEI